MTSVLPRLSAGVADLDEQAIPTLDDRIEVPGYDRGSLTPAVVHIGGGGFPRPHRAVSLDALARPGETGGGEIGVGLRPPAMRDALTPQDCLFTVVERCDRGDTARV